MAQHQQLNQKPPQLAAYRAIAPSTAPPNILPRPEAFDVEKRKWNDADHSGSIMNKIRTLIKILFTDKNNS